MSKVLVVKAANDLMDVCAKACEDVNVSRVFVYVYPNVEADIKWLVKELELHRGRVLVTKGPRQTEITISR